MGEWSRGRATIRPHTGTGVDVYYIHADHLNTPKMVTRPSDNAIMWRWDQDPFGVAVPNQNPQAQGAFVYNLRFPGQYYDVETGFSYNYFRDYDAQVGRYAESDPIGLRGGINSYAYARANPLSLTDPYGLYCMSNAERGAIGVGIGGAVTGGLIGGLPGAAVGLGAGVVAGIVAGTISDARGESTGGIAGGRLKAP